jgi:hypothetical protein
MGKHGPVSPSDHRGDDPALTPSQGNGRSCHPGGNGPATEPRATRDLAPRLVARLPAAPASTLGVPSPRATSKDRPAHQIPCNYKIITGLHWRFAAPEPAPPQTDLPPPLTAVMPLPTAWMSVSRSPASLCGCSTTRRVERVLLMGRT